MKQIFLPITKVDEETRTVYGLITAEKVDKSNEVLDYASSKPLFESWSSDLNRASGGKNYGNVREMHGSNAAGMFNQPLGFDDATKVIEGAAKIVDEAAWAKVMAGVYTGFSIGGKYVKRWQDPVDPKITRYTASPAEVSLVDNPCLGDATFELKRADGRVDMVKFQRIEERPQMTISNEVVAKRATELAKAAGDETKWPVYIDAAVVALTKEADGTVPAVAADGAVVPAVAAAQAEVVPPVVPVPEVQKTDVPIVPEAAPTNVSPSAQGWQASDGTFHAKKSDAEKASLAHDVKKQADALTAPLREALAPVVVKTEIPAAVVPTKPVLAKKKYDAAQRKQMASTGAAMSDGSFPIADKEDLDNAKDLVGQAKNKAAAKRHIKRRAKAIGQPDPFSDTSKAEAADDLKKGLSDVSRLCNLVCELEWLQQNAEWEAMVEQDGSTISSQLKEDITNLCATLRSWLVEETEELLDDKEVEIYGGLLEAFDAPEGLVKTLSASKDPKRFSKAIASLSKARAVVVTVPATQDNDLAKAIALNTELQKQMTELLPLVKDMAGRVVNIEAQPTVTPPGQFRVVEKSRDGETGAGTLDLNELVKTEAGRAAIANALIKASQGHPMPFMGERGIHR